VLLSEGAFHFAAQISHRKDLKRDKTGCNQECWNIPWVDADD
jgi:hypothetical protein